MFWDFSTVNAARTAVSRLADLYCVTVYTMFISIQLYSGLKINKVMKCLKGKKGCWIRQNLLNIFLKDKIPASCLQIRSDTYLTFPKYANQQDGETTDPLTLKFDSLKRSNFDLGLFGLNQDTVFLRSIFGLIFPH